MDTAPELLDFCPPEYLEQVLAGDIELLPGQKADRPVIRWAQGPKKGQTLPKTGRFPRANDIAAVSKATAHKRTASYQEAMNLLMDVGAGPDKKGSFAWWYEQAMDAAIGHPTTVTMICPHANPENPDEGCQDLTHNQRVVVQKKDGNLIFKLLELKHGKAKETKEIDINQRQMIDLMETRQVVVQVYGMDTQEISDRKAYVEGLVEGTFTEVDPETEPVAGTEGSVPLLPSTAG